MLISYALLFLLFIVGLFTTFFIKLPANNKLTALFRDVFSEKKLKPEDEQKKKTKPEGEQKTTIMKSTTNTTRSVKNSSVQFKAELKSVFATFDKNSDGYITKQELKESLKNIGIEMSDRDLKEMVEKVDSNGDGLIDMDEFCELFESIMSATVEEVDGSNGKLEDSDGSVGYLKDAFNVFDGDGDGVITVEELGLVLSSLGFKEGKLLDSCKEMIRKVDVDGDGKINFDEFKTMMKAGTKLFPVS